MEDTKTLIDTALQSHNWTMATLAERLGMKERSLKRVRSGEFPISDQVKAHLNTLIQVSVSGAQIGSQTLEDAAPYRSSLRSVPVLSWGHAGEAATYEELPKQWQEAVPTCCPDPHAFALAIEGDSMQPNYQSGDFVIVMPSTPPRNGCLVVANFRDHGVMFRRYHAGPGGKVRLTAYNPIYPVHEGQDADFHWIYPVHSTLKKEWR